VKLTSRHSCKRPASERSHRPDSGRSRPPRIERLPRGTPSYEAKLASLSASDRQTIELVEESILSDLTRAHNRRTMSDGTVFDLTAYDAWDVLISFHVLPSGETEFIDYAFFKPS
jgi:hypothetical protein